MASLPVARAIQLGRPARALDEHGRMAERDFACLSGCEIDLTDGYLLGQLQDIGRAGTMRDDNFAVLFG